MESRDKTEETSPSPESDEEDDLPPNPFTSPRRPPRPGFTGGNSLQVSPKVSVSAKFNTSPIVSTDVNAERREKKRKDDLVKHLAFRKLRKLSSQENEVFLQEHFEKGGIVCKRKLLKEPVAATTSRVESAPPAVRIPEINSNPPGLSLFVNPINFVDEIGPPSCLTEGDIHNAPSDVRNHLVIFSTLSAMYITKPLPIAVVKWLLSVLLMSRDKALSNGAFSVLVCLLHQSHHNSLSKDCDPFEICYDDVVKLLIGFGASTIGNFESCSTYLTTEFQYQQEDEESLVNNLNLFVRYFTIFTSLCQDQASSICPDKLVTLLARVSLDHHVINSCVTVTITQCIGALLMCYSSEQWNTAKMDQLSNSILLISTDHCYWCALVRIIGNLTLRTQQLQKRFCLMVLGIAVPAAVAKNGDLEFVTSFVHGLYMQEDYNFNFLYSVLDILSMYVSPLELSKEKDKDKLVEGLSLLTTKIHDNPYKPITGYVKESIMRLKNVLVCIPSQQMRQSDMFAFVKKEESSSQ